MATKKQSQPRGVSAAASSAKDEPVLDEEMSEAVGEFQPDPDPVEFDPPPAQAAPPPISQPANGLAAPPQRIYANEMIIDHDLYRLKLTNMKKNLAWEKNVYDMTSVPHEHFFHTVDSSGKQQTRSNMVGGHFHVMTIIPQPGGAPPIVKCGPAVKEIKRLINKRMVKKLEPALRYTDDNGNSMADDHVHSVGYERSNRLAARKINEEAVKVIGADAVKTQAPAGVIG